MTTSEAEKVGPLLSIPEAAERIHCSRSHVYDLIAAGKLRRFNIALRGSKIRVSVADVEQFIASSEQPISDRTAS